MNGPEIERLIQLLGRLPGLGPRSARRVTLHLLKKRETLMQPLSAALADAARAIRACTVCGNLDTVDPCSICADSKRDAGLLCVVEDVGDLWAMERGKIFPGRYHVLGGSLSALDGIGPEELNIATLVQRVAAGGGGPSEEDNVIEEALGQAKDLLEAGNHAAAGNLYAQILQHDPENPQAIAGHLRCLMKAGQSEAAREMLKDLPPEIAKNPEIVAVAATLELAESGAKAGATAPLKEKVAANPADHQTRFDLAMALFAENQREEAVDELLELFRRDRKWNEEAARKQLVKFFEAFGPTDPLTIGGRKRLSSLMFS